MTGFTWPRIRLRERAFFLSLWEREFFFSRFFSFDVCAGLLALGSRREKQRRESTFFSSSFLWEVYAALLCFTWGRFFVGALFTTGWGGRPFSTVHRASRMNRCEFLGQLYLLYLGSVFFSALLPTTGGGGRPFSTYTEPAAWNVVSSLVNFANVEAGACVQLTLLLSLSIYISIYIYIERENIYMYIYRERETADITSLSLSLSLSPSLYT